MIPFSLKCIIRCSTETIYEIFFSQNLMIFKQLFKRTRCVLLDNIIKDYIKNQNKLNIKDNISLPYIVKIYR